MNQLTNLSRIAKHETLGCIFAHEYTEGNLTCYDCDEKLRFVRQHVRNGNPIVAHFRHAAGSKCTGESIQHKAGKSLLVKYQGRIAFISKCKCNRKTQHILSGTYSEEVIWGDFRLDIGVKDCDNVIGAVEVCYKHPIPKEKIKAFNDAGLIWYELEAEAIINCIERGEFEIPVYRMKDSRCPYCTSVSPFLTERLAFLSRRTEMTDTMTPFVKYYDHMRSVEDQFFGNLTEAMDRADIHVQLASIVNGSKPLTVGMFKGYTVETILRMAPGYIKWLAKQDSSHNFPEDVIEKAKSYARRLD